MSVLYEKPKSLNESPFTFCPGCTHGIIVQLVTSVIDELGIGGHVVEPDLIGSAMFGFGEDQDRR